MRRPFSSNRWPLVVPTGGGEGKARARRIGALIAGLAAIAASSISFAPFALGAGSVASVATRGAVFVLGLAAIVWAVRAKRPLVRPSGSYLEADDAGLVRVTSEGTKTIVRWDAPFGVALLASYGRPYALLAFTTPSQTRYVPARIDERTEDDDELFARIAILGDLDLVDGVAHDAALSSQSTAAILRFVERREKHALGRVYLSDGRGSPIALDRATLSVGDRAFDLTSALEWRAFMFHESTGQAAALYQATWVRQAGSELVLVAPMPASIVPREPNAHKEASGRLGRALTREIKLLQAAAETPPPREMRVAIDRPFMMAVRRALADAPLAQRTPSVEPPPRASRPERRA